MIEQEKSFETKISKTVKLGYLFNLPEGYSVKSEKKWPLIMFLHGVGERGTDLRKVKVHGIPKIAATYSKFPFIAVSPQCPENAWWPQYTEALIKLLDEIVANYHVDTERVYLTGLSMGGFGTWHLGVEHPDRFAALAPICGGGHWAQGFPERAAELKEMPIWAFHGAKDDVVPLEQQQALVDVLKDEGGNIHFTVYPDAEHDSWTDTYNNSDLYKWFLRHTISGREVVPPEDVKPAEETAKPAARRTAKKK